MWPTLSQVVALLEHLQPLQFDWATRTAGELMNYFLQSTVNLSIAVACGACSAVKPSATAGQTDVAGAVRLSY